MYLSAAVLGVFSAWANSQSLEFTPTVFANEINTACKAKCQPADEIAFFKQKYAGELSGKVVNFIDPKMNQVSFSLPIEDIASRPTALPPTDVPENRVMDGGLDCNIGSNEPWCDPGWNTSPEWENYIIAVNNAILQTRFEHTVTSADVANLSLLNNALWNIASFVPSGFVASTILKMIEKLGVQAVNSAALQSLFSGLLSTAISELTTYDGLKAGDKIVIENGKRKIIRNGVVIFEQDLIPPGASGSSMVGGGGGEGYPGFPGHTGPRSFCMIRSWGTVTTGGGVTFWVDYTPCPEGIHQP